MSKHSCKPEEDDNIGCIEEWISGWVFVHDPEKIATFIKFCPFCGEKLIIS